EMISIPLLLPTKQEEDADDDEWNVSMTAGTTCLSLVARTVQGTVVPTAISFIKHIEVRHQCLGSNKSDEN
ncbi:hypothetical protein FPV67DRAFT_1420278, partial [Lyophyllum atratum]